MVSPRLGFDLLSSKEPHTVVLTFGENIVPLNNTGVSLAYCLQINDKARKSPLSQPVELV